MNRDKWDAMNDGPYKINQDALPISFFTFHYRAKGNNTDQRENT
jgi:hypothetical protein